MQIAEVFVDTGILAVVFLQELEGMFCYFLLNDYFLLLFGNRGILIRWIYVGFIFRTSQGRVKP